MKVFLTGGTGFIGQPLAQSLIARGWNVVALVRKPESPQARTLTNMGVQCVTGDVTDRESMRAATAGITREYVLEPQLARLYEYLRASA